MLFLLLSSLGINNLHESLLLTHIFQENYKLWFIDDSKYEISISRDNFIHDVSDRIKMNKNNLITVN